MSANAGLTFNPGFLFLCSKAFLGYFPLFFLEHSIIKLKTKRIASMLNFLLKLSDLKLNSTLTLDHLNPALNNWICALVVTNPRHPTESSTSNHIVQILLLPVYQN